MFKRQALFAVLLSILLGPSDGWVKPGNSNVPAHTFSAEWQPLPIGAGGQITAVYSYSDGTRIARGDNYGAWLYHSTGTCAYGAAVYAAPCWQQVITATSIPGFSIDLTYRSGAIEYVAAPSNTNVQYLLYVGNLYVTTDRGTTWCLIPRSTGFPGTTQNANNGNSSGPFIAIDPTNPDVVYVDTLSHGVYRSSNATSCASSTFAQVAMVGTTAAHVIAFQPGSSTHILIYAVGTSGAFESINGSTFSNVTTGSHPPDTLKAPHIFSDKFNQFWVIDSKGGKALWRWANSTWSSVTPGSSRQVAGFAADPNSSAVGSNHIAVVDFYGQLNISSDNGVSWTGDKGNQRVAVGASQPTWLSVANQGRSPILLNGYSMTFDQSSNILFAGGLGVWQTNAPVTQNATVWNANSLGIEQLVTVQIISPPGYAPLAGVWDKGFFLVKTPGVFPSVYWNNNSSLHQIMGGWGLDWASSDSTFITGWETSDISSSAAPAYSTDGGNTWTPWLTVPSHPGSQGGAVAALDSQHWLLQPGTGNALVQTADGGVTWSPVAVTGNPTNWTTGKGVSHPLAADRVAANTFCAVRSNQVFYYSTDAGVTLTASGLTSANVDGSPNAFVFKSVPGQSGNFFYTAGEQSGSTGAHPANTHLWKITQTTNPCDTAIKVSANLREVMAFGFGAHNPNAPGSYPTIYVDGWFNWTQGIFLSNDGGSTWMAIKVPPNQARWPLNQADFPADMEGDMDIYGRIYIAFAQSAGAFIDTQDACPWIGFTSVKPNDSLTGTVTLEAAHTGQVPVTSVSFYVDGSLIGTQTNGSGTPAVYSQSWNTTGVAKGAHTLRVQAVGNGCTTTGNFKQIPVSTH